MTEDPKNGGREQAWLDTLPADELAMTERLRKMPEDMRGAWLGVEQTRTRRKLEELVGQVKATNEDTIKWREQSLTASSKATADAIKNALAAANPTVIKPSLSPATVTALTGMGALLVGVGFGVAKLLGLV